jgi:ribosomal protein S19
MLELKTDSMIQNSLPLPRTLPPPPNTPPIRTTKRAATILPNFVGLRFAVHNGKTYVEIQVTEEMVGRKLGEYVAYVSIFLHLLSMMGRFGVMRPIANILFAL